MRNKSIVAFLLLILLIPSFLSVQAATEKQRIFDDAQILTTGEKEYLEHYARKFSDKRKVDFIIITTDNNEDITKYMGDMYDERGFGYEKARGSVALIALNMKSRDVQLAGFGDVETKLPDERFHTIREKVTPDLSNGNYEQAFKDFIKLSARYMQFKEGANPANPLYRTFVQFFIAIFIGLAIVAVMARNHRSRITTTAATYFDDSLSKVNRKEDNYLRKSVQKTYSPQDNDNNSSGGGGSGGGGSTGGGSSFSGSRGSF